jgi:hypothetical protein
MTDYVLKSEADELFAEFRTECLAAISRMADDARIAEIEKARETAGTRGAKIAWKAIREGTAAQLIAAHKRLGRRISELERIEVVSH